MSLNPAHGEVHWIQLYVIKFVRDLRQVNGFPQVSSTNNTNHHDISEILLKVALNTKTLTLNFKHFPSRYFRKRQWWPSSGGLSVQFVMQINQTKFFFQLGQLERRTASRQKCYSCDVASEIYF